MSNVNLALTASGQALRAKIEAGDGKIPLTISRIVSASGTSSDPLHLTAVVNEEQEFTITGRKTTGVRTSITALLTNAGNPVTGEGPLEYSYPMTQIGFYAIDPKDGEILYRISQFDTPNNVPSAKERGWIYEPTFDILTGNASDVVVHINPAGHATLQNIIDHDNDSEAHEAIREAYKDALADHDADLTAHVPYTLDYLFEHELDNYPQVMVLMIDGGCGMQLCGDGPCGGGVSREVFSRVIYDDRNRLHINIGIPLNEKLEVARIRRNEYILRNTDTSLSVLLFEGYAVTPGSDESHLCGTYSIMSEAAVRQLVADEFTALTALISSGLTGADNRVDTVVDALRADMLERIDAVPIGCGN